MSKAKIAWGLTGAGDQLKDVEEEMLRIENKYPVKFDVFVSKAAEMVLNMYNLYDEISEKFGSFSVEVNSNTPFLVGSLYTGHYEGLIIAPGTSNTVAKISNCIGDSLLSNAALQALKAYRPVHIMPVDLEPGEWTTVLPNGKELKLRVREEDVAHVENLRDTDGVKIIESPNGIEKSVKEMIKESK